MPLIDVSDLLTDPDFVDAGAVTVYRTMVTVDAHGVASETTGSFPLTAAVFPAKSAALQRLPDGERQAGTITVITKTPLITGQGSNTADELVWNGQRYTVALADDWTAFGAGFVETTCTLKQLNP